MAPISDLGLLLVAFLLLAAPISFIAWMGMRRPDRTRRTAEAAARALSLPEQPPLHRRMRWFSGRVMDLQVEIASEPQLAAVFEPVPIEHSLTQGVLVRAIYPKPLSVAFRIDSSRGPPGNLQPEEFGIYSIFKVFSDDPDGLRRLMHGGEQARAIDALFGKTWDNSGRIVRAESRGVFVFAHAMKPEDAAVLAHAVVKAANALAQRDTFR